MQAPTEFAADLGQHGDRALAAPTQGKIRPDPQFGHRLALDDQAHELLRLQAGQLDRERTNPDVIDPALLHQ